MKHPHYRAHREGMKLFLLGIINMKQDGVKLILEGGRYIFKRGDREIASLVNAEDAINYMESKEWIVGLEDA